jgi:dTDP-4-dehydrorhamnose reductase
VKTIKKLASERNELKIISDQVGTPTYAKDLAEAILALLPKLSKENKGVYHYSNEGVTSWYDFAKEIVSLSKIECKIKPIESKDYKTLAERPYYSVLNKSKIKNTFEIEIPYWKESLSRSLEKL